MKTKTVKESRKKAKAGKGKHEQEIMETGEYALSLAGSVGNLPRQGGA